MATTVAFLVSQYPAPSHTFVRREVDELRKRGLDIALFSVHRPGDKDILCERDERDRAETFYILPSSPWKVLRAFLRSFFPHPLRFFRALGASLRHRLPGIKNLAKAFAWFAEGMILADELRRRGISHLHDHFANAAACVAYAAVNYLGIGWSLTLHGTADFDYPSGPLLGAKIARADFLACVSHYGRAQAMRASPPDQWDKLIVSRCGVDLSRLPARTRPSGGRLRLVQVARLSPEKGQVGLMRAFAAALAKGLDAELVLVGDGPGHERVSTAVKDLGLEERVLLPGRKSEAEALQYTADADIFVLSSFMEGLPVVLMEAMAMGVPVIAPAVAGVPELVEHRVTGLTFAAGNWEELASRIAELSGDAALRERLARSGRERVRGEFSIERAVEPKLERFLGA